MDYFVLVAELGIALAGFTGIFLVLARRTDRFTLMESVSVEIIVIDSFFAAFLSLLPISLSLFAVSEDMIWRISSAAYLVAVVPVYVYLDRRTKQIPKNEKPEHMSVQNFFGRYSTIFLAIAQIPNIIGWPYEPGPGIFFLGVVTALGLGAMIFAGFLFSRLLTR